MDKVTWGVLSTANIGLKEVIPAMQKGQLSKVTAIASRNIDKAHQAASQLNIPIYYGSYEELLADKEIDAVYIPLPNHMHVEWTIKCFEAGKHVLCEKPIGLNLYEAELLQNEAARFPRLKLMEAFMYRHHPQTLKAKKIIDSGIIGDIHNVHVMYSYYNVNPNNIRNILEIGGGGLLDIGGYCISTSRFMFGQEPKRVCSVIDYDPIMKVDRLVSAIMEFDKGYANWSCSTQLSRDQFTKVFGTKGKLYIHMPFNPVPEVHAKMTYQIGDSVNEITFDLCDQYTIQGDLFSMAILNDTDVPIPFQDTVNNMKVIERIKESAEKNSWVNV
jgi:predicted dehydrogenase